MLREIVKPTSENYNIHIPKEYINTEVEILVLPLGDIKHRINANEFSEIETFSNHSASTIEEWLDDKEDEVWN